MIGPASVRSTAVVEHRADGEGCDVVIIRRTHNLERVIRLPTGFFQSVEYASLAGFGVKLAGLFDGGAEGLQDLSRYSKEFDYSDLKYASVIIDELLHWDGNSVPNRNQIEYSSKLHHNAKFIHRSSLQSHQISQLSLSKANPASAPALPQIPKFCAECGIKPRIFVDLSTCFHTIEL